MGLDRGRRSQDTLAAVRIRRIVRVSGRVQGVFFRDSCRRQARSLGLCGWVRNTPDGDVEAVFEGETEAVEEMVAWCRRGPAHAVVADVWVADERPRGDQAFRVV